MSELRPGEALSLGTRTDGGPTFHRDEYDVDAYAIDKHGGELSRDEIARLAEAAGLEVHE